MKATAIAPSNIAFIKYWGKKDEVLNIPSNGSISMNLSNLLTTTTVEFNKAFKEDLIVFNKKLLTYSSSDPSDDGESRSFSSRQAQTIKEANGFNRIAKHLDRIRTLAKINNKAKVVSVNNFPTATGLSSSASGFAALTLAASKAAGLSLYEKELSILARQGSGSASRSIPDGFVEWLDGDSNETSYAVSLFAPDHWDIVDVVVIVSKNKKEIPTTEGQKLAKSSPFFPVRLKRIKEKMQVIKKYIREKHFGAFGELIEQEALELHAIMLTSTPPLIYLLPETINVINAVKRWRQEGLPVYFTLNTGQNIHLICQKKNKDEVIKRVLQILGVSKTIINFPAIGARIIENHLF